MPYEPLREIIREHEFEEQLAALISNAEEADKFTLGAEYILAREPRDGVPASPDESVWLLPMSPVRGRQVTLYYTFDETTVVFLSILASDD